MSSDKDYKSPAIRDIVFCGVYERESMALHSCVCKCVTYADTMDADKGTPHPSWPVTGAVSRPISRPIR